MCHTAVENIAVHNWKRTPSVTNRSPRPMEDGMRFQVVYDSSTPVRRRHLAGADAKDRYAITRLVGLAGSIKSRHRGFCFSAPISPPLWFSAQTEKSPSTLSAFAMLGESLAEFGKAQCFFTFCQTVKILFVFFIHPECLFG